MKKILTLTSALCVIAVAPAYASLNVGIDLGYAQPTYVAEPEPTYYATPVAEPVYYGHRHYVHPDHHHDWHDNGDRDGHGRLRGHR